MKNICFAIIVAMAILLGSCKKEPKEAFRGAWAFSDVAFGETRNVLDSLDNTARLYLKGHPNIAYYNHYFALPGTKFEFLANGVLFLYTLDNSGQWVCENSTKNYYLWATKANTLNLQYPVGNNKVYQEEYQVDVQGSKLLLTQDLTILPADLTKVYGSIPAELDSIKSTRVTYIFIRQ